MRLHVLFVFHSSGTQHMASKARVAFDKNCEDVNRLLEIHTDLGGSGQGRKHRLEVLNKSAIVLICAVWEAYCEDLAAEAVDHIVNYAMADELAKDIKKVVAKELRTDKNELAIWRLAGDGWKTVLRSRLAIMQEDRNRRLNTPRAVQIRGMFQQALGITDITSKWHWAGMSAPNACKKLDKYVTLRGEIAHRGSAEKSCSKDQVTDFLNHVKRLVGKTGMQANSHVKAITKRSLW